MCIHVPCSLIIYRESLTLSLRSQAVSGVCGLVAVPHVLTYLPRGIYFSVAELSWHLQWRVPASSQADSARYTDLPFQPKSKEGTNLSMRLHPCMSRPHIAAWSAILPTSCWSCKLAIFAIRAWDRGRRLQLEIVDWKVSHVCKLAPKHLRHQLPNLPEH